jgi:N-acetyl-alpha-D-muramate 1-phosphate uridylyltransferase
VQLVILAGGLGTRMRPRTERIPKFLLPVAGRPFARWLLDRVAASGFTEAVICVGHLGALVRSELGEAASGLVCRYVDDGPALRGTAGALRGALPLLAPTFVVTYGDSYLPFDYAAPLRDLERHPEALGTMAVHENRGRWDASNTEVSGDRVVRYEKRRVEEADPELRFIDYGATALRRQVIAALSEEPLGFDVVQKQLARAGALRAWIVEERFYEIGSEAGLSDLEALLGGAKGVP